MNNLSAIFENYDNCLLEGRYEDAMTEIKSIMEDNKETPEVYFWALKRFGDYVGYGVMKDYLQAIDVYQTIINEYEGEDDLYEWCQLDIAKSYLNMGITALRTFDEMVDVIESEQADKTAYLEHLLEQRNSYVEAKSEEILRAKY